MNLPTLHVLASDEVVRRADFRAVADAMRRDLGPRLALHIRCRDRSGAELFDLARPIASEAAARGGWCVVNGRLDVALAAGCQAVQLGRGALPTSVAVEVAAGRCAVGVSVHTAAEAVRAAGHGANYVVAGTVFRTDSHPGRPGAGPDLIRECVASGLPVVAIGGIATQNAAEVVLNGAVGAAVISSVWGSPDPIVAARALADEIDAAAGTS